MVSKLFAAQIVTLLMALPSWGRVPFHAMGFWNSQGEVGYEFVPVPDSGQQALADELTYQYLVEQEVVYLTNLERVKTGLLPLKRNALLDQSARLHAEDMRDRDYFDHVSLDGRQPWHRVSATGYNWFLVGENIAAGYRSAVETVNSWMESEGHRSNILAPDFREIGVGFAQGGGTYQRYWVQNFASSDVYPVVIENEIYETNKRTVQLAIHGEGIAKSMRVADDPNFTGAEWVPFQSSLSWDLMPGNGTRTVYVQLKTAGGLPLPVQSDSIEITGQPEPTATPTPTLTPTATPTPIPTHAVPLVTYDFDSASSTFATFAHYPGGFGGALPGELDVGAVPTDAMFEGATDGIGLRFAVDPGEVSLLVGPVMDVGEAVVLLRCSVRTTAPGVHIALGALDAKMDGSIGTTILADTAATTNVWRQLSMTFNPPHGTIMPLIQAANVVGSESVICFVDRLEVILVAGKTVLAGEDLGAGAVAP